MKVRRWRIARGHEAAAAAAVVALTAACANLDGLTGGADGGSVGPGPAPNPAGDAGADGGGLSLTPDFSLSSRELTFAFRCAEETKVLEQTLTLKNGGEAPAKFELAIQDSPLFHLADGSTALAGEIPPHKERAIPVVVRQLPAAPLETGSLVVRVGGVEDTVVLSASASGPRLSLSPAAADFGFVRKQTVSEPIALSITNGGSAPVTLQGFEGASPHFIVGGSLLLPPGVTAKADVKLLAGAPDVQPVTAILRPTTSVPLCGNVPTVELHGQRVDAETFVSPVTIDFGQTPCTAPVGGESKITLSNYKPVNIDYSAVLQPASRFAVSGGSGQVPKASGGGLPGKLDLTISWRDLGGFVGDVNEDLIVTLDGQKTTVKLHVESVGAIIDFDPDALEFERNDSKSATAKNSGNVPLCVTYGFTAQEGSFEIVQPSGVISAGGGRSSVRVKFSTQNFVDHDAVVKMTPVACTGANAAAPICGQLPTLPVHGKRKL